ncbi:probable flavin-containing monooxygenase 1 [Nymphaea colorata]|nr:probable flavin-containing monooxygenase 1 [Nymphaea colorata]
MGKRVGIIGAGISGLLSCKYMLQRGYEPIVFEFQSSIGGVWTSPAPPTPPSPVAPPPSSDPAAFMPQSTPPRPAYQFSDFPWPPKSNEEYPNRSKVHRYIESYARHFNLIDCIRFNSKVLSLEYLGATDEEILSWSLWANTGHAFSSEGAWKITVQDTEHETTHVYEVEFVVVCIGKFNSAPKMPALPSDKGPEVFKGKVMHAKEYLMMDELDAVELIEGKKVVIVGTHKSAFDIATQCARENGLESPCTMVITSPNKNSNDAIPNAAGRSNGTIISKLPFALPDDFHKRVEEGSIILEQSTEWLFCEAGLTLGSEDSQVNADIVIIATGCNGDHRLMSLFKSPAIQKLILSSSSGEAPLYRNCIHPRIPQMAIMATSDGVFSINGSETRVKWLVEFFEGGFRLPTVKEMEDDSGCE